MTCKLLRLSAIALSLVLTLALSACSGLQTRQLQSTRIFSPNAELEQWQLRGKIGLKTRDSADSAYLNWLQCGDRYEIRINGPLGAGAAKLVGDSHRVTLYQGDREPVSAASAATLLQQQLGWTLPVTQLSYWIRGIPSPHRSVHGTELGFEQSGWTLTFPSQAQVDNHYLPARAIARRDDIKVTLIFQQWQLQPDCGTAL